MKKNFRASQTRDKESRKKVWAPPSPLDAPPAPTGFRHRWLRAESLGFNDSKNITGRMRSGYELVRADEYQIQTFQLWKMANTRGMIELVALCWQGCRTRSQSKDKHIMRDSIMRRSKR